MNGILRQRIPNVGKRPRWQGRGITQIVRTLLTGGTSRRIAIFKGVRAGQPTVDAADVKGVGAGKDAQSIALSKVLEANDAHVFFWFGFVHKEGRVWFRDEHPAKLVAVLWCGSVLWRVFLRWFAAILAVRDNG